MDSFIAMYTYRTEFFTNPSTQPDTLSMFVKKDNELVICHAEPFVNIIGKGFPIIGSFTGIARIVNVVKKIFQEISNYRNSEPGALWNAFKNLCRGVAEAIPLSGIFLILFDATRNSVFVHSKITKQIENQENIVGVALDGKVIFTLNSTEFEHFLKKQLESNLRHLAFFQETCLQWLKKLEKNNFSVEEAFQKLKNGIQTKTKID